MFHVKDNELVLPGQLLGSDVQHDTSGCFQEGNHVYSAVMGLAKISENQIKVVPLSGEYIPKVDDVVIGVVKEVFTGKWLVDINSAYDCILEGEEVTEDPLRADLRKFYDIGYAVSGRICYVDEINESRMEKPWLLEGGLIINVNPKKIPRVVGKKQSMLNMIKERTKSKIVVGQNGRIWIKSENTDFVIEAIRKIEREAHTQGLTDRIGELLDGKMQNSGLKNRGRR